MLKNINDTLDSDNKDIDINNLLLLAKDNDEDAKQQLIKQYYGLIIYQSKGIFLNSYSFDDLMQTGVVSILKAIDTFDINKDIKTFSSYVFWCIKNNFNYLCRQEIRYNEFYSLNTIVKDNMESMDFIASDETLEDDVLKKINYENLKASLKLLDSEELDLINYIYIDTSNKDKPLLSKYAEMIGKDYYYCTMLKRRALKKLRSPLVKNYHP